MKILLSVRSFTLHARHQNLTPTPCRAATVARAHRVDAVFRRSILPQGLRNASRNVAVAIGGSQNIAMPVRYADILRETSFGTESCPAPLCTGRPGIRCLRRQLLRSIPVYSRISRILTTWHVRCFEHIGHHHIIALGSVFCRRWNFRR